jgi:hypothetical protein
MTIKQLTYTIAVMFGISFLDGMLGLGISDGAYTFIGLVELVAIIWLVIKVKKLQV